MTEWVHLHYCPVSYTTRGHDHIATAALAAGYDAGCVRLRSFDIIEEPDFNLYRTEIKRAKEHDQRVLLTVDFPDIGQPFVLHELLADVDLSVYLGMLHTNIYERVLQDELHAVFGNNHDSDERGYDYCVSLEPGFRIPGSEHRRADFMIAPLVSPISVEDVRLAEEFAKQLSRPFILWVNAGQRSEERLVRRYLRQKYGDQLIECNDFETRLFVQSSREVRAIALALFADGIIASPGYSTFWELHALDVFHKIREWVVLDRPIEDVKRRLQFSTKLADNARVSRISSFRNQISIRTSGTSAGRKELADILHRVMSAYDKASIEGVSDD